MLDVVSAALLAHRPAVSAQPRGLFGRCDLCYSPFAVCEDGASRRQRSSARVLLREAAPPRLPSLSTPDCATLGPHLQPGIVFFLKKHNGEDICSKRVRGGVASRLCSSDISLLGDVTCAVCRRGKFLLHLRSRICQESIGRLLDSAKQIRC